MGASFERARIRRLASGNGRGRPLARLRTAAAYAVAKIRSWPASALVIALVLFCFSYLFVLQRFVPTDDDAADQDQAVAVAPPDAGRSSALSANVAAPTSAPAVPARRNEPSAPRVAAAKPNTDRPAHVAAPQFQFVAATQPKRVPAPGHAAPAAPEHVAAAARGASATAPNREAVRASKPVATVAHVPAAADVEVAYQSVDDDVATSSRSGAAFAYEGKWKNVRVADGRSGASSTRSFHTGDVATMHFDGRLVRIYGVTGPTGGAASIAIDGRVVGVGSFYTPKKSVDALVFQSSTLPAGEHTVTVTVEAPSPQAPRRHFVNIDGASYSK